MTESVQSPSKPAAVEPLNAEAAAARSEIYRWLSIGFRYPDEEFHRQLKSADPKTLLEACRRLDSTDRSKVQEAAQQLAARLQDLNKEALESSYLQAFGHLVRGQLSLYETEYGSGQALRGVHELGNIAGFYRAFGLEVGRSAADRVDHASVECAFMHVLCYKEAYAAIHHGPEQSQVCRDAQVRFLTEHLGWWLPSMARRVLDTQGDSLHAAWAKLSLIFLEDERHRHGLHPVSDRLGLRTPEPSLEAGCMSCSVETACPGGSDALALRSAAD